MCIELLLVLGTFLSDEDRLDRVVPFLVTLISDESSSVRVLAVKVLTQLVYSILSFP